MNTTTRKRLLLVILILLPLVVGAVYAQETKENTDFRLAIGLYNDGMYDLAIDQLKNFIETYQTTSSSIEARFYLGLAQLKSNRFEDAKETFQNFALTYSTNPKAPEAWMNVGKSYEGLKNLHEAAATYERVKIFNPKSPVVPEALFTAGMLYQRNGEIMQAKSCYNAITRDYPSSKFSNSARLSLGEISIKEGQFASASRNIRLALDNASSPEEEMRGLLILGRLQLEEALYSTAESTFVRIVQKKIHNEFFTTANFELGKLLIRRSAASEAIPYLKLYLTDRQTDDSIQSEASYLLGSAYEESGLYSNARSCFDNVINHSRPSRLTDAALMGSIKASLGDGNTKAAIAALGRLASATSDQSPELILDASRLAGTVGQPTVAVHLLSTFIERRPDNPLNGKMMLELANLYENQLSDQIQSSRLLHEVAEKYPDEPIAPRAYQKIAENALKQSDLAGAIISYRQLLSRYPAADCAEDVQKSVSTLIDHQPLPADSLMKKTIALVGEFADNTQKGQFYYNLGLLYADGLKQFGEAKDYFTRSLSAGAGPKEAIDASYQIARCLQRETETDPTKVPMAISAYDDFLKKYPSEGQSDDAAFARYELQSTIITPQQKIITAQSCLSQNPTTKYRARLLFDIASASLAVGDTATATATFSSLASDSSAGTLAPVALGKLGEIMLTKRAPDSARTFWHRAIDYLPVSPATPKALWNLAALDFDHHANEEAIECWKRLSDEFGYTTFGQEAAYRVPEGLFQEGNFPDAISEYRRLLSIDQGDSAKPGIRGKLFTGLAEAYERSGDYQNAIDTYKRYLAEHPDKSSATEVYLALGNTARTSGDASLSGSYFREAAALGMHIAPSRENADLLYQNEKYGDAAHAYIALVASAESLSVRRLFETCAIVASFRMDDIAEGERLLKLYEESLKDDAPSMGEIEYEHGLALYRKQSYTEARKMFQRVNDDYDRTRFGPWGWYYIGKISEVSNKLEDAAGTYDDILKKYPDSDVIPRVLLSLGNMHFNAERYDRAITFYQKIIADSIRAGDILPYALNNLIEADESLKLYEAALAAVRQFIQRYPNDESILDKKIKIGVLYTKIGYYDQAVQQFQNILSEAGASLEPELFYDIGEAYFYKGDYQQAILEFLKVPYTTAKSGKVDWVATSLYMAGQSYEKLTKFEEAITMYQQIIDRPGIDATFKSSARKEITRVRSLINKE